MASQQETAQQIWNYLTSKGWTKEAVAALLGNAQSESGIIADRWESDIVGNMSGGYGLVQWTPASKYIDWAKSNGLVYQDIISQCKRLEWEVANGQQFYSPNMTFAEFTKSTQSPEVLADIFIRYYERPYNPNQPARQTQARYWYNLLKNSGGSLIPQPENEGGETTMQCIYWRPSAKTKGQNDAYYFDGNVSKYISNGDQITILQQIYKANNGKDLPVFHFTGSAPWYTRLEQISAQAIVDKTLG